MGRNLACDLADPCERPVAPHLQFRRDDEALRIEGTAAASQPDTLRRKTSPPAFSIIS